MIRRDYQSAWVLISQTIHARLAGELARDWMAPHLEDFRWYDLLMTAIAMHDDGWVSYERAPTVVAETGVPRDFTEMPMPVSTALWSAGIAAAGRYDPWCGLWVSGHFCRLADFAAQSRHDNPADIAAVEAFLQQQAEWKHGWQEDVRGRSDTPEEDEQFGVHAVRFFDRVSLWLCGADRSEPWTVTAPDGLEIRWMPLSHTEFAVTPFPWKTADKRFAVTGRLIPQQVYADDADLQRTLSSAAEVTFRWRMLPGETGSATEFPPKVQN